MHVAGAQRPRAFQQFLNPSCGAILRRDPSRPTRRNFRRLGGRSMSMLVILLMGGGRRRFGHRFGRGCLRRRWTRGRLGRCQTRWPRDGGQGPRGYGRRHSRCNRLERRCHQSWCRQIRGQTAKRRRRWRSQSGGRGSGCCQRRGRGLEARKGRCAFESREQRRGLGASDHGLDRRLTQGRHGRLWWRSHRHRSRRSRSRG